MHMQEKPHTQPSWGVSSNKAWYVGPCFKHYQSFQGVLPLTKSERISDTIKFNHHAVAIPEITPVYRIIKASKQLKEAIQQQPKKAPMEDLQAIKLLREVMLGKTKPQSKPTNVTTTDPQSNTNIPSTHSFTNKNRALNPLIQMSKCIITQSQSDNIATPPPLTIDNKKYTRGYQCANLHLQLNEWA